MAAAAMVMPSPAAADKAEKLSLKYWQEGNLTSEDQICDGFFDVNGEFPELGPGEIFPDFQFLSQFEPEVEDMREVPAMAPL